MVEYQAQIDQLTAGITAATEKKDTTQSDRIRAQ
jgi:hypothetical protein